MKKTSLAIIFALFCFVSVGCEAESTVVEAPPANEETSIEGMSEEDYDAAMEASLNEQ